MLKFEWDREKAKRNFDKHNVAFKEAATVFGDPMSLTIEDADHSPRETRMITLGRSSADRLVGGVHLDKGEDTIRLISARAATRKERMSYEQEER